MPVHVGSQHGALERSQYRGGRTARGRTFRAHAEIDCFYDVHEGLVFLVLDVGPPPARRPSRVCCDLRGFFLGMCEDEVGEKMIKCTAAIADETILSVVIYVFRVSISLF
jgi:hypothetical protein